VWGIGGTLYAVGYDAAGNGVIWYNDGGNVWKDMNPMSSHELYGIWGSAQDNIYVAGEATTEAGCILKYDGVDDNLDGSLWDPVTGGTQLWKWCDPHSGDYQMASTDYPLGDPAKEANPIEDTDVKWSASNAGWSIVVIYTSPETKGHQLYLFDTLRASGRYNTKEFLIEGFLAPASVASEADAAKMTCFVGEGDGNLYGENLYLVDVDHHAYLLNDGTGGAGQPANNVWNSISDASLSADGVDIDTFYISGADGYIDPGDSELTVRFYTGQDVWNMVYMILSLRSDLSGTGLLSYVVE